MTDLEKLARMAQEAHGRYERETHEKAITALRQAINNNVEHPAKQRHIAYVCPQCYWTLEEQPAQQEPWVELTNEEIAETCGFGEYTTTSTRITFTHLARAIEAKLKEKNIK